MDILENLEYEINIYQKAWSGNLVIRDQYSPEITKSKLDNYNSRNVQIQQPFKHPFKHMNFEMFKFSKFQQQKSFKVLFLRY